MIDDNALELSAERRELLKLLLDHDPARESPVRSSSHRSKFPLSFVQERMWVAERVAPAGAHAICIEGRW
jgi:hypothetical protein